MTAPDRMVAVVLVLVLVLAGLPWVAGTSSHRGG